MGNYWAARANFEQAAAVNPSLDLAWLNLAVIAAKLRDQSGYSVALGRLQILNPNLARSVAGMLATMP
jgi:hypothetical protein